MNRLIDYIGNLALSLSDNFRNTKIIYYYLKALGIFALLKLLWIWPVATDILAGQSFKFPRALIGKFLLLPSTLAEISIDAFYGLATGICLVYVLARPNYFLQFLFFWIVLNVFRVNYYIIIGADYVLLMLSLWAIPLAVKPLFKNERIQIIQRVAYSICIIIVQLHIVFVYLISGLDKILSSIWRSGDAFAFIRHFDTMLNPGFTTLLENPTLNIVFSWLTIGFELAFVVLVWIPRARFFILAVGVVFHGVIWLMLSLPDFAIMMILSYLVFLKDTDYTLLKNKIGLPKEVGV